MAPPQGEERNSVSAQVVEDPARVSAGNPEKTIRRAIIGVNWNELGRRQADWSL